MLNNNFCILEFFITEYASADSDYKLLLIELRLDKLFSRAWYRNG